jgi:uncharacterized protein
MAEVFHRSFLIDGPAGHLEAMLWTVPQPRPPRAALICHPHPLFGGTMHNKVVFRAARAIHARGIPVLRFNFRGAGQSEGAHDQGAGEKGDVRAALDFLAAHFPEIPVLLGGFSFGAWVGLEVGAEDPRVTELIGIGIPVNKSDLSYLMNCSKPKLFLHGSEDPYGERSRVEALVARMPGHNRLVMIEGTGHFFEGKLEEMSAALDEWLGETLAEGTG